MNIIQRVIYFVQNYYVAAIVILIIVLIAFKVYAQTITASDQIAKGLMNFT